MCYSSPSCWTRVVVLSLWSLGNCSTKMFAYIWCAIWHPVCVHARYARVFWPTRFILRVCETSCRQRRSWINLSCVCPLLFTLCSLLLLILTVVSLFTSYCSSIIIIIDFVKNMYCPFLTMLNEWIVLNLIKSKVYLDLFTFTAALLSWSI